MLYSTKLLSRIFKILKKFFDFFENFENLKKKSIVLENRNIFVRNTSCPHACQISSLYLFWMPYYSLPKSRSRDHFGRLMLLLLGRGLGSNDIWKLTVLSCFWDKTRYKTCIASHKLKNVKIDLFWPDLDLKLTFWPQGLAKTPQWVI